MTSQIPYTNLTGDVSKKTILLKGPSGAGKTTLAAQFPKPVIFSFDNNLTGLNQLPEEVRNGVKVIDPRVSLTTGGKLKGRAVWDNFISLMNLVVDDDEVDTIVVDSLTTLQENLMDKILGSESPDKSMKIQDWGTANRYWKTFGEEVMATPHGKHIIVIAHEVAVEDGGVIKYQLNLGGTTKNTFDIYFSDVWRCFTQTPNNPNDTIKYMVATQAANKYNAKRSMKLPNIFEWDKEKSSILERIK